MRLSNVLVKPIITEKSVAVAGVNKYTFKTDLKASKHAIANEVKRMYNVDVIAVKTMVMTGKKNKLFLGLCHFDKGDILLYYDLSC